MNARAGMLLALAVLPAAACNVGLGSGDVTGMVQIPICKFEKDGTPIPYPEKDSNPFNFKPSFFLGQPVDADPINAPRFPANQMIIRVQPSAKRVEDADVLVFFVLDSAEVARCIRGASPNGVPEWDPMICDRSTGEGRMLIGMTYEKVSAFLALNHSCPKAEVAANALGACTDGSCPDMTLCPGHGSWITFSEFGPDPGSEPIKPGYKVNDGNMIAASDFHLELCDSATVGATLDHVLPIPEPNIIGVLNGNFQFELVRQGS